MALKLYRKCKSIIKRSIWGHDEINYRQESPYKY